ncbi:MAG: hypothetical protein DRO06_03435 [Thermoproteota archaeon]|nr:MAG: hypothetical protein DRO06_03435 [Candidatus Korarchaeota archaeon]
MSYLKQVLSEQTACVGFIGIRGASKTWTAQLVLELLALRGWHSLIVDVKGEDETIHLPARGKQALSLRSEGLSPRGWDVEYLTFRFPLAMEAVPVHFRLVPLSVRMLSFGHFRLLGGFLSESEVRDLFDAYYSAGGPDARLEDLIEALLRRKGERVSPRLMALLTSGFLDDSSPLEPDRLVDTIQRRDFTVLSTAYFKPSVRDLGRFALNVVIDNLMGHLVQSIEEARIIVHFRELRDVAPRVGAMGAAWHLKQKIENFVTLLRQTRTALTRVFYEVQNVKSVPKTLLENTQAVFVHPMNLKQEAQLKELERYFPVSERVKRAVAPMRRLIPGKWIFLSKDGHAEIVTTPPPMSLRIPEPRSPDEAARLSRMYRELVPRRRPEEEIREARRMYRFWMARARVLKRRREEEELELEVDLPPPETMILDASQKMALLLKAIRLRAPLDGRESLDLPAAQVSSWVRELWGQEAQTRVTPNKVELMIRSRKKRGHLRIAGISFYRDTEGNLRLKVDVKRFLAHMKANESRYDRALGRFSAIRGGG